MNFLRYFRFFLWYFGRFQAPLIGYLTPRIILLDDHQVVIKIPLKNRAKNHLNSMYFGAFAVGADIAGGLHGFYYAKKLKLKISLMFKSFRAEFLHRAESDVYFICAMGEEVKAMMEESQKESKRVNKELTIKAVTNYGKKEEEVANLSIVLSLKVLK